MKEETVYSFFLDTVKYEINFWSYWIYLALERGYLKHDDPISKILEVPFTETDIEKIHDMEREDVLCLNRVKLFATLLEGTVYAFYFAESVEHAVVLHKKIYGTSPTRWHDVYKQMRFQVVRDATNGTIASFWEIKDELLELPYYVGELDITELRAG